MKRMWQPVAALAVLGALLVAALWWRNASAPQQQVGDVTLPAKAHGAPDATLDANRTDGAGADTGFRSRPTSGDAAQPAPLPALDTPLGLVVDDLRRRADAGDASAACRLAAEFERCRRAAALATGVPASSIVNQAMALQAARDGDVERAERYVLDEDAEMVDAMRTVRHCSGVTPPDAGERAHYWRRAALGGNVAAMRHYAIGNAFRLDDLMHAVPQLELYRREAEQVALRAAAAGDPVTIQALASAYQPHNRIAGWSGAGSRPFLGQVVEPDPRKALVWLYALEQHPALAGLPPDDLRRRRAAGRIAALTAQLAATDVAAARTEAGNRARGWPPGTAAARPPAVHARSGLDDVTREDCEPGAPAWQAG